jgi:polyhydroxyalkanoate synthesis regulator phasin
VQYYPDPQKALMQQYNRGDINEKTAKVDAKKAEVESLKQQVADLEDTVRKAGGDPGWVR